MKIISTNSSTFFIVAATQRMIKNREVLIIFTSILCILTSDFPSGSDRQDKIVKSFFRVPFKGYQIII